MIKNLKKYISIPPLFLITCLCLSFFVSNVYSNESIDPKISVISSASKKRVGVGDKFYYVCKVTSNKDAEIWFPEDIQTLGSFEIKDSSIEEKNAFNSKITIKHFLVRGYDSGEQSIPGIEVRYNMPSMPQKSIITNKVNVLVESVFQKAKIAADIQPIEGPINLTFPYKIHLFIIVILLTAFVYLLSIFIKKKREELADRRKGPADDFRLYYKLSSLVSALERRDVLTSLDFASVTDLMSRYLKKRLGLKKGELTTEEFLFAIRSYKS